MSTSSNPGSSKRRRGSGRRRTSEARVDNDNNLKVTFSKRRAGLFKKASELVTLCGAEIGLILFSPSEKAFTFGHPNINTIIDNFLEQADNPQDEGIVVEVMRAQRRVFVDRKNMELTEVVDRVQSLKMDNKESDDRKYDGLKEKWIPTDIDEMDINKLNYYMQKYLDFKKELEAYI